MRESKRIYIHSAGTWKQTTCYYYISCALELAYTKAAVNKHARIFIPAKQQIFCFKLRE
jgi:hypothetical protein